MYDDQCECTDVPHPPPYFTAYMMTTITKDIDSSQPNIARNVVHNIHYISHTINQARECVWLTSHMHIVEIAITHANDMV